MKQGTGASATSNNDPIQPEVIATLSVFGCLLLLLIPVLCIWKRQRARRDARDVTHEARSRAAEVTREDENPTYGDYFDPDPRAEVEDTNDYYSSGSVDCTTQLICLFWICILLLYAMSTYQIHSNTC